MKLYIGFLLLLAVLAISSAATAFSELGDIDGCIKSSGRLQITSYVQFFLQFINGSKNSENCKKMIKFDGYIIILGAIFLSIHFSTGTWSLELTSMAHSLLLVSTSPLIIIVGSFVICKKVLKLEIIGVALGLGGIGLMAVESGTENDVTGYGDLLAFAGALSICGYLLCGKYMLQKKNYPLGTYLFLLNLLASILCYIYSLVLGNNPNLFYQGTNLNNLPFALYLGVVSGILGHAIINYLLKYMKPVVITSFINFEPVIGSLIGGFAGFQETPGGMTWVGGAIVIIGNILVTVAKDVSKGKEKSNLELESDMID